MVVQPDGKILVAGSTPLFSGYLARLLPDGEPDASFGVGGIVVDHGLGRYTSVALEPDGSILGLGNNGTVARYRSDGRLDTSFGQEGHAGFTSITDPSELVVLPDGRILVGGDQEHKLFSPQALLALLSADGRSEEWASGGAFGTYMTNLVGNPDGSVLMTAGAVEGLGRKGLLARFVPGSTPSYGEDYTTLDYPLPEPGWDKSFGDGAGLVAWQWPGERPPAFRAQALASAPSGIFVGGSPGPRLALTHFGQSGVFDAGFGEGGFAMVQGALGSTGSAADAAVTTDGKVLLLGDFRRRGPACERCRTPVLARFLADGRRDPTFGRGGITRLPGVVGPEHGAEALDLTLLAGGDALVAGLASERTARSVLGRIDSSGAADPGFGKRGVLSFKPCAGSGKVQRHNGCLPSAEANVEVRDGPNRSLSLRLVVAPRERWWPIGSLRLELPPALALVPGQARRARFSYRGYGRNARQQGQERGGALVFDRERGMEPGEIVLTVPPGVIRRMGPTPGPPTFRLGVGFSPGYHVSAGTQILTVSGTS
jgi:uncharacterized delta-60 repeat protein